MLIKLAGCTGTGKTDIALRLLEKHPIQIISCDSVQVYKDLNIGSNKTTHTQTHKLINLISFNETYDVERYVADVDTEILKCKIENKIPMLVGGTGLYMSRAGCSEANTVSFFITEDRVKLCRRVDRRCETMILEGLVDETYDLMVKGMSLEHMAGRSVGYRDCLIFLQEISGDLQKDKELFYNFLNDFQKRTRNYVRKQECWFKKRDYIWIDGSRFDVVDIISKTIENKIDCKNDWLQDIHKQSIDTNLMARKKNESVC